MSMSKGTKIFLIVFLVFGLLFFATVGVVIVSVGNSFNESIIGDRADDDNDSSKNAKVAVVTVSEIILTSKQIIEQLVQAEEDKKIKAIIISVDSPGGSVAPTQEIYEEIRRIDQIKPVYASMGSVAASGGYYISAAARKIYANPGTLTGSIGVIMNLVDMSKLYEFAKMSFYSVKSGKYKDSGSPYRRITPEEEAYMSEVLADVHSQFINDINKTRKERLKKDLHELAQGQIFSGAQAKEYGLVDELGGLWGAARAIHKELNISGKCSLKFIKSKKKSSLSSLLSDVDSMLAPLKINTMTDKTPMLLYGNK
jgi:protease-4